MKLKIVSDLHLDVKNFKDFNPRNIIKEISYGDFDTLIVAGDFCEYKHTDKFCKIIRKMIPDKNIIITPGNHDFWGIGNLSSYEHLKQKFNSWATILKNNNIIHGLNNVITVDDKKIFLSPFMYKTNPNKKYNWIDFIKIIGYEDFHNQFAKECEDFLMDSFKQHGNPDIVVTHTFPNRKSIRSSLKNYSNNIFYHHELPKDLKECLKPKVWIHGHTHYSFDYIDENIRYVCNPKGNTYYHGSENILYNPNFTIEI